MIELQSVILKPPLGWPKRIGPKEIHVTAVSNDRGLPLDIVIRAFGEDHNFKRFGQCAVSDCQGVFAANIETALQPEGRTFLSVVGLHRVLFLDPSKKTIEELLRLFRAEILPDKRLATLDTLWLNTTAKPAATQLWTASQVSAVSAIFNVTQAAQNFRRAA